MKNKKITRLLALILCMVMVASVFTVVPVHASSDVSVQNGTGTRSAIQITGTYSYRAYLNGSFDGFAFAMPTWNTTNARATLYLYKWQGSYAATVASTPLYSTSGKNHADCTNFTVTVPTGLAIMGDIYYEIQYVSGSGAFTGWTATSSVASGVQTYVGGTLKAVPTPPLLPSSPPSDQRLSPLHPRAGVKVSCG